MGAGASSSGPLGRTRSGVFKELDEDGSGTISLAEFSAAARAVGVEMKAEELKECFAKYDADGSGEIDASEFQHFFDERVSMYQHEDKVIVDQLSEEGLANIVPYIGPKEASRGFRKAHLILERNPAAAAAPMSDEVPLRPLHLLLLLDSPVEAGASTKAKIASAEAACKAAGPLILKVLTSAPEVAAMRVQKRPDGCPVGKLALHLAIERQWPADIVKAIAAAHPEALRTLDPIKTKKGQTEPVAPLPKKGKGRWARGLAEEYHSSEDVLVLLPMPKKNKKTKEIDWIEPSALVDARKGHARAKKSKK